MENETPVTPNAGNPQQSGRKKHSARAVRAAVVRYILRTVMVLLTTILLVFGALVLILNAIFNGPSPAARDVITMSMLESSGMKWVPAIFIGEDMVEQIQAGVNAELPGDISGDVEISIDLSGGMGGSSDEWANYADGIRIETITGDNYTAYVMIVRDPSQLYVATSTDKFSYSVPGERITNQIEKEGAIACVNGGAFYDNGTGGDIVGSVPCGLVISEGKVVWDDGSSYNGFVGFNEDNILIVAKTMTAKRAQELNIRDGCCFGPVLLMDGVVNDQAYNENSGFNPRTAIGQRADGAIVLVCVDGRQPGSLGATYADLIDIMVEYKAVNACNLDGGSSSVMLYRDMEGRYGNPGEVVMINSYSALQAAPRRMPTYIMVRPKEG